MHRLTILRVCCLVVVILISLSGCIDIVSELRIADDGSGTVALQYSVAKALMNLGAVDTKSKFYTLPVSKSDFENAVAGIDGLEISSYDITEETDVIKVNCEIAFDSVEALSEFYGATGPGSVSLTTENGTTVFKQVLFPGTGSVVDEESAQLVETFFDGYTASFELRAPGNVTSVSSGSFSGRTATVDFAIPDVVLSQDPVVWEVRW